MQKSKHSPNLREDVDRPESISPTWIAIGSALFVATLAAPVAVVHMASTDPSEISNTDVIAKAEPVTPEGSEEPRTAQTAPLRDHIAEGPIEPGVRVGGLHLGDDVDAVLASVTEPPTLVFDTSEDGMLQSHDFSIEDIKIMVQSNPDVGRIDSLHLAALDCETVRTFQPRQDGLPQTEDGITIGSHVSRVIKRLGEPEKSSAGEAAPLMPGETVEHVYPGMVMRYCQEDMLIAEISVVHRPGLPPDTVPPDAQKTPGVPMASLDESGEAPAASMATAAVSSAPNLTTTLEGPVQAEGEVLARSAIAALPRKVSDDFAAADSPDEPRPATTRADRAPRVDRPNDDTLLLANNRDPRPSGAVALPPSKPVAVAALRSSLSVDEVDAKEPEPLLALRGGAYALSDAFEARSAMRVQDAAAIAAGEATSEAVVLADLHPVAPTAPLVLAKTWESDLALTPSQQRAIQIRLGLIGLDPRGADGIFGPNTRVAIQKMQERYDLPATGYLDEGAKTKLETETRRAFASFLRNQKRAQRRRATPATGPVIAARMPTARNAPECARDSRGQIIENQSFSCDGTLLSESLNGLGSAVSSLFSGRS